MRKINQLFWLITLCSFFINNLQAQEVKLNKMYVGSLADIVDSITKTANLKVQYDRALLSKYRTMIRPMNEPALDVLSRMLKDFKFEYTIDSEGKIYIYSYKKSDISTETTNKVPILTQRPQAVSNPQKYNFTLTGKVIDNSTGEAIPYAIIEVEHTDIKTYSNVDGYFSILKTPSDTVWLYVTFGGYAPFQWRIAAVSGSSILFFTNHYVFFCHCSFSLSHFV